MVLSKHPLLRSTLGLCLLAAPLCPITPPLRAAEPSATPAQSAQNPDLFRKENLAAWCIVPFDRAKRSPEERAAMLEKIGIRKFVHDYRSEHVPLFEEELLALKKHGIELTGWMFPAGMNAMAESTLALFDKHGVKPQLWIIKGGGPVKADSPEDQLKRVQAEVRGLAPVAKAAAERGLQIGLYNHGGWYGEPENQIEIIEALRKEGFTNVGIVYNLHHGHGHLSRFKEMLAQMKPYLLCLNLNGMDIQGDSKGRKILPIGVGTEDRTVLQIIRESGYTGLIGILNHTGEDAELRLLDNLDGLAWINGQLQGKPAGEPPVYRTWKAVPKQP
jgi:sugar phosphate isomerase/epimerase